MTPWTAAHQAFLSITNSQSLLKLISIESVMPSIHLIFVIPFSSCLQSFPSSGSFQMSQLFTSGGQSIGVSASASILPMNTQDFRMDWLDLLAVQGTLKNLLLIFQFSSVQSISRVRLFVTHGLQHTRPPCPSPTPGVYPNPCHCVCDAIRPSHPL